MTYALIASIFLLLVGGIIYDIFGRLTTVSFMFALGALATIMPPYVAPNVPLYILSKVLFNSSTVPLQMNPFINDYVKVQFRGQATGLQTFGLTIGNLCSVAGLYSLTSMINNRTYAFLIIATLQLVWILLISTTGMVSEPKVMDAREEKKINKKSFFGKIYSVLKQTYKACK
jgi:MFS family permease